ncbi:nuclear transport factor 2 family protein [Sphingomonas sp. G-3-2-10]|uniref:nuclear transport factor 2 family protein n=1 Tax=Sphingomonas sp. G-3-2-10 TaxID=2728838 RepID=UPI00146A9E7A|nr:nuclear transport factor 2 family protein [Sphingomonas sp. G-3-2-10]NML07461.1 nuclear transport factor 2 family protein [Sphingomonas sp. G-3-2-10]
MTGTNVLSVEDRLDIQELLARYAWTFDTGDVEGFVGCFTADAVLCEDAFEEPDRWEGAAGIRAMAEFFFSRPSFPGRQHHVSHIMIDGQGDEATVRSFCFVTDCKGEPPFMIRFAGHYLDKVVRQDGRWLFRDRLIRDWSGEALAAFPGQGGVKVPRARPPELRRPGFGG